MPFLGELKLAAVRRLRVAAVLIQVSGRTS